MATMAACTVIENAPRDGLYIGLIFMKSDRAQFPQFEKETATNVGFWTETGAANGARSNGIGWRHSDLLIAAPDCRIIFLIDSDEIAEAAVSLVKTALSERDDLCVEQPVQN